MPNLNLPYYWIRSRVGRSTPGDRKRLAGGEGKRCKVLKRLFLLLCCTGPVRNPASHLKRNASRNSLLSRVQERPLQESGSYSQKIQGVVRRRIMGGKPPPQEGPGSWESSNAGEGGLKTPLPKRRGLFLNQDRNPTTLPQGRRPKRRSEVRTER